MADVLSVDIVGHGTALRVRDSDGTSRLVRRVDLSHVLGDTHAGTARMVGGKVAPTGVELEFSDGSVERLSIEQLAPVVDPRAVDLVVTNTSALLTCAGDPDNPLGIVHGGAVLIGSGRILWVGTHDEVAGSGFDTSTATRVDAEGRLCSPGLVDCHAHPVFAGNRADEFARRAAGQTYLEIADAGGGINATLGPTRNSSFDDHLGLSYDRMSRAFLSGTTTCEAKSGYDLTCAGEVRLLEIAAAVGNLHPVDISPTLLGAHLVPPEYHDSRGDYVDLVAGPMITEVAQRRLANAVDVYCDVGAFTLDESRIILSAAKEAGLHVRGHVGQFSDLGGAELLAELGALSADHLEFVSAAGIAAMAANGVTGVMLPGACVQLRQAPPDVGALRAAGVSLAVASDMNPGSTRCETLPVQMWLASTHYGMTVTETWLGVTRRAARVLGRRDIGVAVPGAAADLVLWDAEHPAEIPYHYGTNLADRIIKSGRVYRV